ncbi:SDR family NAD(P)-dependent oxidoreductase [Streptomyces sp. TS71-3]|uniref:SDR family NAD(P)-dependent oxidoreductase n=1 Tax=Streptomyces sp. TS71-3 TaxID=2733862 RepID=UPI001B08B72C|nr:oxidoreductase [Streptomyces sp. TS71-3]GHJ37016.1 3-oxoacyl-ACP reductase [Streptomyces sp. TS71-3]
MDLKLNDKVAVVTGASKGMGLAIAEAFAREGVHVVAGSRSTPPELEALREKYGLTSVSVDLSTSEGPDELVRHAVDQYGRLDILVNTLGAGRQRSSFLDVDDAEWQRIINMNLFSAVRTTRAALPRMLDAGEGCVVNLNSINAHLPYVMVVDYSAAKAALGSLTKSLSEEFAPRGIRVNAISPGPVRTPFWTAPGGFAELTAAQAGTTPQEAIDVVVPKSMGISTGRVTEPHEVADLALFLASPLAGNITGAEFIIDGGQAKMM